MGKASEVIPFQLTALECVRVNLVEVEHSRRICGISPPRLGEAYETSYRENTKHVRGFQVTECDQGHRSGSRCELRTQSGIRGFDPGCQHKSQREG